MVCTRADEAERKSAAISLQMITEKSCELSHPLTLFLARTEEKNPL